MTGISKWVAEISALRPARRARRNAYRQPPWAGKAPALARLHQLDREHDGYRASRLPNVNRWQNAAMALRWTAAGMLEAAKGFRRLKAYKHLPVHRAALQLINPSISPTS